MALDWIFPNRTRLLEHQTEKRMELVMETGFRGISLTMENQTKEKTECQMETGVM